MHQKLLLLERVFRAKVSELIANCKGRGVDMVPFCTLRTPWKQAELWRQSRSTQTIHQWIKKLHMADAPFLVRVLEGVGPQYGRHVTNALPGISWHQWGEAVDCFWLVGNEAVWSTRRKINGENGYRVYAEEAERLGLTAGGHWNSFKDWPHIQSRVAPSPLSEGISYAKISTEMQSRYAC